MIYFKKMEAIQHAIIEWFSWFPAHWAVFLLSMIPITEIRASIPLGITVFGMGVFEAVLWGVLGNVLAGVLVLLVVEPLMWHVIKHSKTIEKLWHTYVEKIKTTNTKRFEKWGSVILVSFVAIPLPMTGVFTGAVAASIFQIPVKKAVPLLFLGSLISSCIIVALTLIVEKNI